MRNKPLAALGAVLLFGGVLGDGAIGIWAASKQEWNAPAPDRPIEMRSKRVVRFVSNQVHVTRNLAKGTLVLGLLVMLFGGWPQRREAD